MKRSCCEERQKRGHLLSAAIVVAEKRELRLTPGRIHVLKFTTPLTAMVSYSKLKADWPRFIDETNNVFMFYDKYPRIVMNLLKM
jgi:hypothetical protein